MASLWAKYKAERERKHVLETEHGFATYYMRSEKVCYLEDIYVLPDYRKSGLARALADQVSAIALDAGAEWLLGSVSVGAVGDTDSLKVLLSYGMELDSVSGNLVYFRKKLKLEKREAH